MTLIDPYMSSSIPSHLKGKFVLKFAGCIWNLPVQMKRYLEILSFILILFLQFWAIMICYLGTLSWLASSSIYWARNEYNRLDPIKPIFSDLVYSEKSWVSLMIFHSPDFLPSALQTTMPIPLESHEFLLPPRLQIGWFPECHQDNHHRLVDNSNLL